MSCISSSIKQLKTKTPQKKNPQKTKTPEDVNKKAKQRKRQELQTLWLNLMFWGKGTLN